jgi:hypothetical protein
MIFDDIKTYEWCVFDDRILAFPHSTRRRPDGVYADAGNTYALYQSIFGTFNEMLESVEIKRLLSQPSLDIPTPT